MDERKNIHFDIMFWAIGILFNETSTALITLQSLFRIIAIVITELLQSIISLMRCLKNENF